MHLRVTLLALLTSGAVLLPQATLAAGLEEEVGVVTRVSPALVNVHFNPSAIVIGSFLYFYVQGGEPGDSCNFSDTIIAYRAPLDPQGDPGTFSRVGRISPCITPTGQSLPVSYGPGQVIRATTGGVTQYHLLADASDTNVFKKIWHATSTDGINWRWEVEATGIGSGTENLADPVVHTVERVAVAKSFLETSVANLQLLNPIVLSTAGLQNDARWWGFLNYTESSLFKVGRFIVDWAAGVPTAKIVTSVDGSGNYFFTDVVGGDLNFAPLPFLTSSSIKTLFFDVSAGTYQAWGGLQGSPWSDQNVNCDTTTVLQCNTTGTCVDAGGNTITGCVTDGGRGCVPNGQSANVYEVNTIGANQGSNLAWWEVDGIFAMDTTPHQVLSKSRFIPSGYVTGRYQPFRWNSASGKRFLFSASNDTNICSGFLFNQFWRSYIVMTEIDFHAEIFSDGFGSGDTSAWSDSCPPNCS